MTCFLVDDQLMSNGKILDALERAAGAAGDEAAAAVLAIWTATATSCGAGNTEGVIAGAVVLSFSRQLMIRREVADAAVQALVDARIWHDAKALRRCDDCQDHVAELELGRLAAGTYLWHGWGRQQFSKMVAKDPVARSRDAQTKDLHRNHQDILRAVRRRDGARCRYCAEVVDFRARRGPRRGTYDHVIPDGGNSMGNVVVACGHCNGDKKDRTPEEWMADPESNGRPLLPSPLHAVPDADEGAP